MKESMKNKIFAKIQAENRGWVFSAIDFLPDFKRWEIDRSLTDLEKDGLIRRILSGLYHYPEYSEILKEFVAPSMRVAAKALARKYDWKIFPEGNTALYYLDLSTQVPGRYIYISSGSSRKYKIGNLDLEFRHRVPKESAITDENANLAVQAIKAMGKVYASEPSFIKALALRFTHDEWVKIENASKKVAYWILGIITRAKDISNG